MFLVLINEQSMNSEQVKNEINAAFSRYSRNQLAIVIFKVDTARINSATEYYLGRIHMVNGFEPPFEDRLRELVNRIAYTKEHAQDKKALSESAKFRSVMITPALCFEGRDAELTQLSEDLATYGKVFVSGMGGVGKSELVRAFLVRNKGHFRSALHATYTTSLRDFYEQLQLVLETEGETAERIGWAYYNVALAKNYCNDRAGAIDYFEKALAQFESIQMDYAIANVYDSISECYFSLENYEKSQEYLFRALGLFRALE